MYEEHFGLKETPFTIAPDPRFLYMSERHREALAHLVYGFDSDGGFVLLSGEVGTGKTTISRCLLEQIPANSNVAVILNPRLLADELLASICDELHIEYPEGNTSLKVFIDRINTFLLETNAQGRKTVVIIEEGQNLDFDVLEQLRLLTNLETNQRKLLQIIIIGQPELLELLAKPELRQLEQRITARYHLLPLSKDETFEYVRHRLAVAGLKDEIFTPPVLNLVYRYSSGVPRKINLLCDRALLGAYVQNKRVITQDVLKKAAKEVFGEGRAASLTSRKKRFTWAIFSSLILLGGIGLAASYAAYYKSNNSSKALTEGASSDTAERVASSAASLSIIDAQPEIGSKEQAFEVLFKLWGVRYLKAFDGEPCQFATNENLSCLRKNGNLRSLKHLNRPAILKMINNRGRFVYVAITALDDTQADISVFGEQHTVLIEHLQDRWFGAYTVLWRMPPFYEGALRPGKSGRDVKWLSTQLAHISGSDSDIDGQYEYDDQLIERVRNFQIDTGLLADGIAGTQTLIHINTRVSNNVPLLSRSVKREDNNAFLYPTKTDNLVASLCESRDRFS